VWLASPIKHMPFGSCVSPSASVGTCDANVPSAFNPPRERYIFGDSGSQKEIPVCLGRKPEGMVRIAS
jgi:hypothetical protein